MVSFFAIVHIFPYPSKATFEPLWRLCKKSIEEIVKNHRSIEKEIVDNIIELSTINSISTFQDFEKLSEYTLEKCIRTSSSSKEKNFELNDEYEKILKYIDLINGERFYISDITNYFIECIKSSIIDKQPLTEIVNKKKAIQNREEVSQEIHRLYDMFNFNMTYKVKDFVDDLFKVFNDNSSNIVDIINSDTFIFYINLLKELDSTNKGKYHSFGMDRLKSCLDIYIENNDNIWGFERDKYLNIQKFDNFFEEYVVEQIKEKREKAITDINEVISLMKTPIKNSGWGKEPQLLSLLDEKTIETYVLESQDFVETSFGFIRYFGADTSTEFKPFIDKVITVFKRLKNSDSNDYKIKMTKLLNFIEKN